MVVAGYPSLCSLMVGMISLIAVTNLQGWERGRKRVFACILAVTLFMFWLIFTLISLVGVAPLATKPGAQVVHGIDLSLGTTAAAMALATSARIVWRSPRPARRPRP